ncbi:MAG: GNAT family N-acetyltransferase [Gaiella sp.]
MIAGFEIRAPAAEDVEQLAEVLNRHSRAYGGIDNTTAAEVRAWFSLPVLDPAQDMRVVVGPTGELLAYADISGQDGGPLHVDLRVPPAALPVAPSLLSEMERRGAERGAPPRALWVHALGGESAVRDLLEAGGYRLVRASFHMEVAVVNPLELPRWPAGIAVRPYRPHEDLERVHAASEEAFSDHWGYHPTDLSTWQGLNVRETLDPSLWFLAEDAGEIAGICLCRIDDTPDEQLGWVHVLAVRRPWRRRGLGRALLLHAFAELRVRGRRRVGLSVDAENTTGAVGLYESVGMRVVRRGDTYERSPG